MKAGGVGRYLWFVRYLVGLEAGKSKIFGRVLQEQAKAEKLVRYGTPQHRAA